MVNERSIPIDSTPTTVEVERPLVGAAGKLLLAAIGAVASRRICSKPY